MPAFQLLIVQLTLAISIFGMSALRYFDFAVNDALENAVFGAMLLATGLYLYTCHIEESDKCKTK